MSTFPTSRFLPWLSNLSVSLRGALWIGTLLVLIDGLVLQFLQYETLEELSVSALFVLPIVCVSLLPILFLLRCRDEKRATWIALGLILFSMACRLLWVSWIDSYQVNDFRSYMEVGCEVAKTGHPEWTSHGTGIFWKRSAVYTYPIALLFGPSPVALKLANVFLITLAACFFFATGKILHGAKAAAIGLIFFIWMPDLWYSMTLATHDVPGVFWLSLFFFLCAVMQQEYFHLGPSRWISTRIVFLSFCLGAALFFLDFTRSYQYPAILAIGLYLLLIPLLRPNVPEGSSLVGNESAGEGNAAPVHPHRFRRLAALAIWMLIFPVGLYRLANSSFWDFWRVRSEDPRRQMICFLTTTDVEGSGRYEDIDTWYENQCPMILEGERRPFALRKLLHEISHSPLDFIAYLERKNRVLNVTGDYVGWATTPEPEPNDPLAHQAMRINSWRVDDQYRATSLIYAVLLFLAIARLWLYPRLPFKPVEFIVLLFSGILYAAMLLVLEVQGRYDIFLVFPLSWMAAQALLHFRRSRSESAALEFHLWRPSRWRLVVLGVASIILVLGLYFGAARLIADSYFTLRDQSGFTAVPSQLLPEAVRHCSIVTPVFYRNNYESVMVGPPREGPLEPESIIAVQRGFAIEPKPNHHLRFFLSVTEAKRGAFEDSEGWSDANFQYLVAMNGHIIQSGRLNDISGDKYFSLGQASKGAFASKVTLQLILCNLERIESVTKDRGPVVALKYIDLQ
jgi:hypothetical protein